MEDSKGTPKTAQQQIADAAWQLAMTAIEAGAGQETTTQGRDLAGYCILLRSDMSAYVLDTLARFRAPGDPPNLLRLSEVWMSLTNTTCWVRDSTRHALLMLRVDDIDLIIRDEGDD